MDYGDDGTMFKAEENATSVVGPAGTAAVSCAENDGRRA